LRKSHFPKNILKHVITSKLIILLLWVACS